MNKTAKHEETAAVLTDSLKSTGLSGEELARFMQLWADGGLVGALRILRRRRLDLLEEIHSRQKTIDLIDCIIHKIRTDSL